MLIMMNANRDSLWDYVRREREQFDLQSAPEGLWDRIDEDLGPPEPQPGTPWRWILAGLVVIAAMAGAYYLGTTSAAAAPDERPIYQSEVLEFAGLEDFEETREYYITQVSQSWHVLSGIHSDEQLERDLQALDTVDQELREELGDATGMHQEYVLRALIQNQQTKLNLINNVLEQIQTERANENMDYETI